MIIDQNVKHKDIHVTISLGVAEFEFGDTMITLIEKADNALYESKNDGRNITSKFKKL